MGKGKDAKKSVKKDAAKTPKEKKLEKKLKKAGKVQLFSEKLSTTKPKWSF